jgi:hypothetical protein
VFTSIMLSALFYTTLLATTFVMPLILATTGDAGLASAARESRMNAGAAPSARLPQVQAPQVWDRTPQVRPADSTQARAVEEGPLDIGTMVEMHRALRFPQLDVPGAGQAAADKTGPDAAMVKSGKVRAKTIKA